MIYDLLIRNGSAALPNTHPSPADLAVSNGKIAAILAPGQQVEARTIVDATGLTILPGIIDVHLHLGHGADISRPRAPSDAASETAAAAAGGVTTFIPYLLAAEAEHREYFRAGHRDHNSAGARIDFGYHLIISTEDQLASVPHYVREFGVPSFKIFMNNRGGEGARLGLPEGTLTRAAFLYRARRRLRRRTAAWFAPHPENIEVAQFLEERPRWPPISEGTGGLAASATRRGPPFVEADVAGPARRHFVQGCRVTTLRRPHLLERSSACGGTCARQRRRHHDRNLPALFDPRCDVVRRRCHRQDQSAKLRAEPPIAPRFGMPLPPDRSTPSRQIMFIAPWAARPAGILEGVVRRAAPGLRPYFRSCFPRATIGRGVSLQRLASLLSRRSRPDRWACMGPEGWASPSASTPISSSSDLNASQQVNNATTRTDRSATALRRRWWNPKRPCRANHCARPLGLRPRMNFVDSAIGTGGYVKRNPGSMSRMPKSDFTPPETVAQLSRAPADSRSLRRQPDVLYQSGRYTYTRRIRRRAESTAPRKYSRGPGSGNGCAR